MNFFQLIYAYIKNLKTAQEIEDSDEEKNNGSK